MGNACSCVRSQERPEPKQDEATPLRPATQFTGKEEEPQESEQEQQAQREAEPQSEPEPKPGPPPEPEPEPEPPPELDHEKAQLISSR